MSSSPSPVRLAPPFVLAWILTPLGWEILPSLLPREAILPLALIGALLLAALLTFRTAEGWNTALLGALALVAGTWAGLSLSAEPGMAAPGAAMVLALAGLVLALAWRFRRWLTALMPGSLSSATTALRLATFFVWGAAWVYVLGWLLVLLLPLPPGSGATWAAIGLVIFGTASFLWGAHLPDRDPKLPGAALAAELYLLTFNWLIALAILRSA